MELRIAQPRLRDSIQSGCGDDAAEGARNPIALIVCHNEQDVGCALRRHDSRRPPGLGLSRPFFDHTAKRHRWRRKLLAVQRHGGVGRTWHTINLLRGCGRGRKRRQANEHNNEAISSGSDMRHLSSLPPRTLSLALSVRSFVFDLTFRDQQSLGSILRGGHEQILYFGPIPPAGSGSLTKFEIGGLVSAGWLGIWHLVVGWSECR